MKHYHRNIIFEAYIPDFIEAFGISVRNAEKVFFILYNFKFV